MSAFSWLRRVLWGQDGHSSGNGEADAVIDGLPVALVGGRHRTRGIPYVMPRDGEETNRLDFQHYLLRQVIQRNYAAPITDPRQILDVGTGTGRWAREMAQEFPRASVIGVDVNPPPADQAAASSMSTDLRPPNYSFSAGNILEHLSFPDGAFDFVHMRLLVSAIPHERWSGVISELARVTSLGGWVESVETAWMEQGGPALNTIQTWGQPVMARRNIDMADGARVGEMLTYAGLGNVVAHRLNLRCGEWGGRIGRMVAHDYLSGAKGFGGLLVAQHVASQSDVDHILSDAEHEFASPNGRCIAPIYIAYGQRVR